MFNSISDWIKIPQVQVPNVNIPNVKIPDIFGMNKNKEGESAENKDMQDQHPSQQQATEAAAAAATTDTTSSIPTTSAAASAESEGDHEKKGIHNHMPNMPNMPNIKMPNIDIDPTKALGQAKELGTNIGSMNI